MTGQEAILEYLDADLRVVKPGQFVRCAVTGAMIPLGQLKYWSVDRQEAYVDAQASFDRSRAARSDEGRTLRHRPDRSNLKCN